MPGRLLLAAGLAMVAGTAAAHDLSVDVSVEGADIVIAVRYEDGSRPATATVVISGPSGAELARTGLDDAGRARLSLEAASGGVTVESFDGDGHATYRILTPADIEALAAD